MNEKSITSLDVAKLFGKRHKSVLESIRKLSNALRKEQFSQLYEIDAYTAENGKRNPMYKLNYDGFWLLVMGFSCEKAIQLKIEYMHNLQSDERSIKQRNDFIRKLVDDNIELKSRKEKQSLYIIERESKYIKIGISKNPQKRLNTLKNTGGFECTNKYITKPLDNARDLEQKYHKILEEYRMNGEWFDINFNSAITLLGSVVGHEIVTI